MISIRKWVSYVTNTFVLELSDCTYTGKNTGGLILKKITVTTIANSMFSLLLIPLFYITS